MSTKEKVKDIYSLSPLQRGMLFHSIHDPDSPVYVEQLSLQLEGKVNLEYLEQSIQALVQKYDIFRTVFRYKKNDPVQIVLKERVVKLYYEDVTHLDRQKQLVYLKDFKRKDRERGFDLSRDMLLRFSLLQTAADRYEFMWSHHHILMDGWCVGIVLEELLGAYRQLIQQKSLTRTAVPQYGEYIRWLKRQDEHKGLSYWTDYLAGFESSTGIPQHKTEPNNRVQENYTFTLGRQQTEQLSVLARVHQVTLSTVIQSIWGTLLHRYNQTNDSVFGAVVSGRPTEIQQVEQIIGLFINTIPVRVTRETGQTFADLLKQMQSQSLEAEKHAYISLADIQTKAVRHGKLLDHIVVFENFPFSENYQEEEDVLGFRIIGANSFEQTNYGLTLVIIPGDELTFTLKFNPALYSLSFLKRVQLHLNQLVSQIVLDPQIPLETLELLTQAEVTELLCTFNNTAAAYPQERTLHHLFEEQAERNLERIAVVMGAERLTYGELNTRANRLAHALLRRGVKPEQIIGLVTERSLEMIVAILAIVKAGGVYLPIDPSYPPERIRHMLADSGTALLLVQRHGLLPADCGYEGEMIDLSAIPERDEAAHNPVTGAKAEHLAYVMYTSGSTGQPKGVMITHRNVVKTIINNGYLEITPEDRVLQLSNYAFDGSTFDIYGALLNGAALVIAPRETMLDIRQLERLLQQEKITITLMTTALFNTLVDLNIGCLEGTRKVLFGGEQVSVLHVQRAVERLGPNRVIHLYGPTETTVYATSYEIGKMQGEPPSEDYTQTHRLERDYTVPIGRPVHNTSVYIVNTGGQLQPVGVAGELCVGGDGVARGYLNRPELTAERFVENPWAPGTWMYRTGDLARWREDGTVEYLGRMDEQVKIRGHRIELGEIETVLLSYPGIREVVVTAARDTQGHSSLRAYVVSDEEWSATKLRRHLGASLPEYMIPGSFTGLGSLPLTLNGKVDKRALPEPTGTHDKSYVAPANETEEKLANLFQELLGAEQVSTEHSFFELGGHSLKAMSLVARIHKELNVEVPVREVFLHPTVQELASLVQTPDTVKGTSYESIEPAPLQPYYPASHAQRRMYIVQQVGDVQTTAYNMPLQLEITGALDTERMAFALKKLIHRHESLRTSFHMVGNQLVQQIHKDVSWEVQLTEADDAEISHLNGAFIRPFDLGTAPLFRAQLVRTGTDRHVLMLDMHHIISDGVSTGIWMKDLTSLYVGEELLALQIQYKDYAVWQQGDKQAARLLAQKQYWLNEYTGELPVLELPTEEVRPAIQQFEGSTWSFEVPEEQLQRLKKVAADQGVTLYMILLAAYQALLAKYTGQDDIIVGTPIAGRPHADLEGIVGMFVNTLALRFRPQPDLSFDTFLNHVKEKVMQAYTHADYPFEELVEQLSLPRNLSRHPLFDTVFALQNMDTPDKKVDGLAFRVREVVWDHAKFDLSWMIAEDDKLSVTIEYSTRLFTQAAIERMGNHFTFLLQQIVKHPRIQIGRLELVNEIEKSRILTEFNDTALDYPKMFTIQHSFEEQARRAPDQVAVVADNGQLTYGELNNRANQLAREITNKGIGRGHVVAIMMEPSLEMFISILAVIKAGSAYLPIDPEYGEERVSFMLEDSQAKLIMIQEPIQVNPKYSGHVLVLGDVGNPSESDAEYTNSDLLNGPSDLAYMIYTSGSTGQPKGVMIEHQSLMNLCMWHIHHFDVTSQDRATKYAGPGFDASVWEIFPYLASGASIYIIPAEMRYEVEAISRFYDEHCITISFLPTQFAEQFMQHDHSSLRWLLTGGDKLQHVVNKTYRISNNYGPTENTVCATTYTVDPRNPKIPIGHPIANNRIYIVNKQEQLLPVGVPGELWISGESVARGYWNRAELTNERFITDPFVPGNRVYKTGDLGRWLEDGNIEYIGRIDDQVKIRGYRVETGEVEAAMRQYGCINEVIVLARSDHQSQLYLCAYVVPLEGYIRSELRQHVNRQLPHYMVPAFIVELAELPLTANGKVDKKALMQLEIIGQEETASEFIAPAAPVEVLLADIWADILGVPKVGIYDNFFELGGDSIKAIQIAARLNQHELKIQVKDLFQQQTISGLLPYLQAKASTAEQGIIEGVSELTPIQQWFFKQNFIVPNHWNQSMMLYRAQGWEPSMVDQVFRAIVQHHDALRMVFRQKEDKMLFTVRGMDEHLYELVYYDISEAADVSKNLEQAANELQGRLNLEQGPLVQVGIFHTKDGDHLLMIIHHLVVDFVSWGIITEDLTTGYEQALRGEAIVFPQKTGSYLHWTRQLAEYAVNDTFKEELSFWADTLLQQVPELPRDHSDVQLVLQDSDQIGFRLNVEQTQLLLTDAHFAYSTQINDLLLAGLVLAVQDWAGMNRIAITLEGHGREDIGAEVDITRTVGWFTSMFPVVFELHTNEISHAVKQVKEQLRLVPNKGAGYMVAEYLTSAQQSGVAQARLQPEIAFNYFGQLDASVSEETYQVSPLSPGHNINPANQDVFPLSISGMVMGRELLIQFTYNRRVYERVTMEHLVTSYQENLIRVIQHCVQQDEKELTPSDFTTRELTADDMNAVFELLGE
ncbi:non-ribosomal peptide synthetase [Paenibacillus polymyxa]|uniref:non-ribosomal peptide synthetase n=1 Tax=Paenibacillus polymyxa TaxID=1406 RepID=UPI00058A0674|nr:non-ribosomal peptide synthetase [Paenibacillus polymyxa]AJE54260.1 peptide ligase [Paenibacillus polymyxa]